ncbi:glutathionylspermidine synthase family protein, partial [Escherichia coli]|uniref:glutathionylspermidine synthase family protein n=1 Tax=Escherichia coli TaxID=562 RepID=UPI0013B476F6
MKRVSVERRQNWVKKVEELGFNFHTIHDGSPDPLYWDERTAYEFTSAQVDELEEASQVLYQMCLSAVDHVIRNNLFS